MIVVTGATGFIGSALIWQLNEAGHSDIIAVDTVSPDQRPGVLEQRSFSKFFDQNQIWSYLSDNPKPVNAIIHMGACSSTTEENTDFLRENNTEYTQRLFEFCRDQDIPFIYASSGAVYGDGAKGFSDQTPPSHFLPLNPYGESKAAFDRWVVQQQEAPSNWYGLRFFNVFGPGETHKDDMASVIFKAFHQINEKGNLKLFRSHHPDYRDGEQLRDFVYVKDITQWVMELLEKKPPSGIYNMGFGKARSWIDLATAVFTNMNRGLDIDWIDIPEKIRDRYQYETCADMEASFTRGLTSPRWSLEDGIKDYIEFLTSGGRYL